MPFIPMYINFVRILSDHRVFKLFHTDYATVVKFFIYVSVGGKFES